MTNSPTYIRKQASPIRKQAPPKRKQAPPTVLLLLVIFACFGLNACGNISSKNTSAAGTTTTATTAIAKTAHTPSPLAQESSSSKPPKQSRAPHFGTATFRHALAAFAACMRHNGVKLGAPDTSGAGPVFSTKGVNTASATFKAASAKCQSVLRNAFPRAPQRAGKQ